MVYLHTFDNVLGETLLDKFNNAVLSRIEQLKHLNTMEEELDTAWVDEWQKEVEAWEDDSMRPNPYEPRVQGWFLFLKD